MNKQSNNKQAKPNQIKIEPYVTAGFYQAFEEILSFLKLLWGIRGEKLLKPIVGLNRVSPP